MEKKSSPIIIISIVTGIILAALVGILVYFNLPAQRIRRMLKSANKYIAEENYDEAILTLKKMLEIDPKNEDLFIMLADTYEKNGEIDKEVEFLQEAVTLMPENHKISEVLTDVYPEVTISEAEGTYKDPVRLELDAPEESKIYYIITGTGADDSNSADSSETGNKENEYSEPITLEKNGKYSIEYYAVSKNGYEGEHKNGTYIIELDESKYHFNEWVNEADGRHYYDANGKSVTGWKKIGELWYLFDKSGVMLTGLQEDDGKTYYLGTDGAMFTGWQEINGKRYYFDESGAMLKNQWIDGTYYVGNDGAMLVDTKTPDGKKVGKDGKKVDEAWKQIYIQKIKDVEASATEYSYTSYKIGFVDDDDIPELIYRSIGGESGVMTYYAGKSNSILTNCDSHRDNVSYIPYSGLINYVQSIPHDFDYIIYRLKSGQFTKEHEYGSDSWRDHGVEHHVLHFDDIEADSFYDEAGHENIEALIKATYDYDLIDTNEYSAEEAIRIIENW
ncbi:tetratricopeptide repeat protein [Oribacterium sp. FC2011]|uniref:tetratricopeptide repeat protein n=1 Tax=Oribacterium sp. FC2011 TaxID=1408311 RepID=UPI0006799CF7|nr:tetratricopeptide repeat protein [Oribacterium sp. FC2011]